MEPVRQPTRVEIAPKADIRTCLDIRQRRTLLGTLLAISQRHERQAVRQEFYRANPAVVVPCPAPDLDRTAEPLVGSWVQQYTGGRLAQFVLNIHPERHLGNQREAA